MSDFGAYIEIAKKNNEPISLSEAEAINPLIEKMKESQEFSDSLGEDFLYNLTEIENSKESLLLTLSEYWYGEDDDEENFEFAEDNDLSQAQEISKILEKAFGTIFTFEAKFENW